jgi:streptogrisin D
VLTAGHCPDLGGTWTTSSGQTIGPAAASSFPGNDHGAIRISNPAVLNPGGGVLHDGAFHDITGVGRVPVGPTACKTGSTTGTTCGSVLAYNLTVNYAEGTVFDLTRTNICNQPGDRGGALYADRLAQGHHLRRHHRRLQPARLRQLLPAGREALTVYGLTLL